MSPIPEKGWKSLTSLFCEEVVVWVEEEEDADVPSAILFFEFEFEFDLEFVLDLTSLPVDRYVSLVSEPDFVLLTRFIDLEVAISVDVDGEEGLCVDEDNGIDEDDGVGTMLLERR